MFIFPSNDARTDPAHHKAQVVFLAGAATLKKIEIRLPVLRCLTCLTTLTLVCLPIE